MSEYFMREEHLPKLKKIETTSRVLLPLLYLLLVALTFGLIFFVILMAMYPTSLGEPSIFLGVESQYEIYQLLNKTYTKPITPVDKLLVAWFVMMPMVFYSLGVWYTVKLVKLFKKRIVFHQLTVRYSRRLAYITLAYVVVSTLGNLFISTMVMSKVSVAMPEHGVNNFVILGLIWLFVWIIEIGEALHLDSEMTI